MVDNKQIDSDIVLEKTDGKRALVNAFNIAAVEEKDKSCVVVLKDVHVAAATGARYNDPTIVKGYQIEVNNSFDEIYEMKKKAQGLGL